MTYVPPDMTKPLPEKFVLHSQPYGTYHMKDLKWSKGEKYQVLVGTIEKGKTTSYLCGHQSTRDVSGETTFVYGVTQEELDKGEAIRVAM